MSATTTIQKLRSRVADLENQIQELSAINTKSSEVIDELRERSRIQENQINGYEVEVSSLKDCVSHIETIHKERESLIDENEKLKANLKIYRTAFITATIVAAIFMSVLILM